MGILHLVLLSAILFQSQQMQTIQQLFGRSFRETTQALQQQNAAYLEKQGLAKPEIAERNKAPESLPSNINFLPLNDQNIGAGIVSSISKGSIITKQLNLIFCIQTDRVMAVQILIGETTSTGEDFKVGLLQQMFSLPASIPFEAHRPAMKYPLRDITYTDDGRWQNDGDTAPVSVWDSGTVETVFQPIRDNPSLNGQIWFTDKTVSNECVSGRSKQ